MATSTPNVEGLKNALVTYGPLVTTMAIYTDIFYYKGGVYSHTSGARQGSHVVLIVGYSEAGQYFIAKNSWGTGLGETGYFQIAYSEVNSVVHFGDYTIAYHGITPACSLSASLHFPVGGGTGHVKAAAVSGCTWAASTSASWISLSETGGTGSGVVSYTVATNTSGVERSGTLNVAGQSYAVTQEATASCTYSTNSSSQPFGAEGGTGNVGITAPNGCSWTASSWVGWITITAGATGSGNGTVRYTVSRNPDTTSRTGTLAIAGKIFTVTQEAGVSGIPAISVYPTALNFGNVKVNSSVTKNVTVTNTGAGLLAINGLTFEGMITSVYKQSNNCSSLAANASCTISVTFTPRFVTGYSAGLIISSNDPARNEVRVSLTGKGLN